MSDHIPKIAVIGECFIDRYFVGSASRLSPEAPVPVVAVSQSFDLMGGAGNVSANLRSLGARPVEIFQTGHYPTKNRLLVGSTQLARWDEDDTCGPLSYLQIRNMRSALAEVDAVIISDYGKGMFKELAPLEGNLPDVPIFIDTKQSPFKFVPLARNAIFFPNLKEYTEWRDDYDELEVQMVLKLGAEGMRYQDYKQPARARSVVSVSGAGDTAIAAFAYHYSTRKNPADALEFASKACAIAVAKPYTATVSQEELYALQSR